MLPFTSSYVTTSETTMPVGATIALIAFYLAMLAFGIYMYVRVARKAGYPGGYALLMFIPFVNLIVMLMFVFSEWPIERELAALRARVGQGYDPRPQAPAGYPAPQAQAAYGYPAPAPTPTVSYPAPGYQTPPTQGYPAAPTPGTWPAPGPYTTPGQ